MAAAKIIERFDRIDLWAILPSGFYVFTTAYVCITLDFEATSAKPLLWEVLKTLAQEIKDNPVLLIFLLFASYLLGTICRAIPVRWAERIVPPFKDDFPYPDVLEGMVDVLRNNVEASKHDNRNLPDFSHGVPPEVFNYWKDVLCVNSPDGFSYYQSFEARVRLFAGIMWAGLFGILTAFYVIIRSQNIVHGVGLPVLAFSLFLFLVFGLNFRRVREQEARVLGLVFIAFLQKTGLNIQQGHPVDTQPRRANTVA